MPWAGVILAVAFSCLSIGAADALQETVPSHFAGREQIDTLHELELKTETLKNEKRYDEAEQAAKETLAFAEKIFSMDIDLDGNLGQLAGIYYAQGKYDEAIAVSKRRHEILKNYLGERHPETVSAENNVALLYKEAGRYPESEAIFKKLLAIVKEEAGDVSYEHTVLLMNLADLYALQGQFQNAEPLVQEYLALYEKKFATEPAARKDALNEAAAFYEKYGKEEQSQVYRKRAEKLPAGQVQVSGSDSAAAVSIK